VVLATKSPAFLLFFFCKTLLKNGIQLLSRSFVGGGGYATTAPNHPSQNHKPIKKYVSQFFTIKKVFQKLKNSYLIICKTKKRYSNMKNIF
jgi:hypothetical protein